MTVDVLVAAILSLQNVSAKTATRFAKDIYETTSSEDDAAALIVIAHRESNFSLRCVKGIGGKGSYGLGYGYERWACRSSKIQAVMALQALYDKGWSYDEHWGFRGYLGARSDTWPEIGVRMKLWTLTYERIRCACSL